MVTDTQCYSRSSGASTEERPRGVCPSGGAAGSDTGCAEELRLLIACIDNLMCYLQTGCRQHAARAVFLLERAEARPGGDAGLRLLYRGMRERLSAALPLPAASIPNAWGGRDV